MGHANDNRRMTELAQAIAEKAMKIAKEADASPRDLIRAMSAATTSLTASLSHPGRRMISLMTVASVVMDDALKLAKSIQEEGGDENDVDDAHLH